ncbi:MAG: hypothetical protein WBB19_07625 [Desulforhopalus sp.]
MESSKVILHMVFWGYICHYFIFLSVTYAEVGLNESIDCTDVTIDYAEDSTLTREERLRLMDKAFFESLNKFEMCQALKKMTESAGSASGDGGGGAAGGDDGGETSNGVGGTDSDSGGASTGQSVASTAMTGTESPPKKPSAEEIEAAEPGGVQRSGNADESGTLSNRNAIRANGKLPADIPSAENDDALAAQIRYAAENEADPVKSKQLWNEYRKYKGLAPQK